MQHISAVATALLILVFPVLASAQQQSGSVCADSRKNAPPASSSEIILTVCNHTRGMAPIPQPRLFFRLYRSGRVEYEVNVEPDRLTGVVSHKLLIKNTRIAAKDVAEILRLGEKKDFQKALPVYPIYQIWDDSSLETTLVFKHRGRKKTVTVKNFSTYDAKNREHYPASLLAMLQKIWDLRPPDHQPTVRDILINQPNFTATETFTSSFMGHGFSTTFKKSKLFDCYRRQSASQIIYSCPNKPDVIFYPKTREYREETRAPFKRPEAIFISDVQTFAQARKDIEYTVHGTEKIGEQECLKIEATVGYDGGAGGYLEFIYVFYAAKNLNNLVIGVDIKGSQSYASSRLQNVRLDFPHKLFQKPVGYRLKRL